MPLLQWTGILSLSGMLFCCADELSKWAAAKRIYPVAELPRTSVGKIDKKLIRQMLATGEIN